MIPNKSIVANKVGTVGLSLIEVAIDAALLVALLQSLYLRLSDRLQVGIQLFGWTQCWSIMEGNLDEPTSTNSYFSSSSIWKILLGWYFASNVLKCVLKWLLSWLFWRGNCFLPEFSASGGLLLVRMESSSSLGWFWWKRPPVNFAEWSPDQLGKDSFCVGAWVEKCCMRFDFIYYIRRMNSFITSYQHCRNTTKIKMK